MVDPNIAQPQSWWTQWPAIIQAASAVAQVIAAIIIVLLTRRLVQVTETYATLTKVATDISNKQYELSTKQYEDDASPMWHLSLSAFESAENELWLKLHNLSNKSAIVTYVLIRAESEGEQESHKFVIDLGLPGLTSDSRNMRRPILQTVESHIDQDQWSGILEVSVVFTLGGSDVQLPSQPFRFKVAFHNGRFTSVQRRLQGISVEPQKDV
jgi:hypothetical protein